MTALSATGRKRLAQYELTISEGVGAFWKISDALMAIHDEALYREDYANFEDYCRKRWNFTARRARQLMYGARMGTAVPIENERQARELVGLEPAEAAAIVEEAKAENDGKLTAPAIRKARQKRPPTSGSSESEAGAPAPVAERPDAAGQDVDAEVPPPPPSPAPNAAPIDTTAREVDGDVCPFCKGTGRKWAPEAVSA